MQKKMNDCNTFFFLFLLHSKTIAGFLNAGLNLDFACQ